VRVVMAPLARLLFSLVRSEACKGRREPSGAWTRIGQVWIVLSGGRFGWFFPILNSRMSIFILKWLRWGKVEPHVVTSETRVSNKDSCYSDISYVVQSLTNGNVERKIK
jgi:hypothetical protein